MHAIWFFSKRNCESHQKIFLQSTQSSTILLKHVEHISYSIFFKWQFKTFHWFSFAYCIRMTNNRSCTCFTLCNYILFHLGFTCRIEFNFHTELNSCFIIISRIHNNINQVFTHGPSLWHLLKCKFSMQNLKCVSTVWKSRVIKKSQ